MVDFKNEIFLWTVFQNGFLLAHYGFKLKMPLWVVFFPSWAYAFFIILALAFFKYWKKHIKNNIPKETKKKIFPEGVG